MGTTVDKAAILDGLRARLRVQLAALTQSQRSVQSGAIHEENRQEHPKDTRAIEAQYLARGLAERVETLAEAAERLARLVPESFGPDDPIAVGALVTLELDDSENLYFVVPAGGGERLEVEGRTVATVTPVSPLGRALVGRHGGDTLEVELPAGRREAFVVRVD